MSEINSSIGVSNVKPQVAAQAGSSSFTDETSAAKDRLSGLRGQISTADSGSEGISFTSAKQPGNVAEDTIKSLIKDGEDGDPTSGEHSEVLSMGYSPDQVDKWRALGFSLSEIKDGTAEALEQEQDKPRAKASVVENPSLDDEDPRDSASLGADTVTDDPKKPGLGGDAGKKRTKVATASPEAEPKKTTTATPEPESESASIADA